MPTQLSIRITPGEAPFDPLSFGVATLLPRRDVCRQGGGIGDAPADALAVENSESRRIRILKAHFVTRYVGAAYPDHAETASLQNRIAAAAPGVITIRTESILREARDLLAKAGAGLAVIAGV
ncbi:MAG: hypothetical protein M3436_12110 [Pseudomonadota bacterium]|nr:hypothetical protein [Pseudomonadota bacterium]